MKLSALMKLTRVEHSLMLIVAVIAAQMLCGTLPALGTLILSLITASFISMGAFAINDYFDVEVDRANKKYRPIVTGDITKPQALGVTIICMAIGIVGSFMINNYCLAIAVIFAVLSLLYSYKLKEIALVGNMYVAFSMSIPFIFGNYVVSNVLQYPIIVISLMIFLSGLAREIDGTIRDYNGDKKRNASTLPIVFGIGKSAYFAFLLYDIAVAISFGNFLFLIPFAHNAIYLASIAISDFMLLYSGYIFLTQKKSKYDSARNISLVGMAIALVSILISVMWYIRTPF